jgi:hypothetical protein
VFSRLILSVDANPEESDAIADFADEFLENGA